MYSLNIVGLELAELHKQEEDLSVLPAIRAWDIDLTFKEVPTQTVYCGMPLNYTL